MQPTAGIQSFDLPTGDESPSVASRGRCDSNHNVAPICTFAENKQIKKTKNKREQKTKFTQNVTALGNMRGDCSQEDSEEEKQFSAQVKEITGPTTQEETQNAHL